ncbi:peroxiredoxin [Parvularcula flava]|uniref:Glutathione-dependent peroxiredoxin n=1 Tax=Aquisalinus luteolus TaxID=1566827 RepID=A0A8J3A0M5_9PROT|nr:peroxiredoxin [Aquisalinus luteolus]NHK26749.1 peroxiredoxin [Aquisalinus luteolus]GGH93297.1 peroxiredoxin [Aquisalinus luteolus]
MTIAKGDRIPDVQVMLASDGGPDAIQTAELFAGKKTAFFAVPGAFTPTCSAKHLPGFVEKKDMFDAKGVDQIVCMSVNDAFVMDAWAKDQEAYGKVVMVADGNGDFTQALGLAMDGKGFGMGLRSKRFSMIVNDGVVEELNVEEGGAFEVSSADYMLGQL